MGPEASPDKPHGIFVGLATLDIIQRVRQLPGRNAKATALRQDVAGGGPALNAAVIFSMLGGNATLVTRLGQGSISSVIREDLASHGVAVVDFAPTQYRPSVSTIIVDDSTGDRQIVSTDALEDSPERTTIGESEICATLEVLKRADVVHLDGHHPDLALAAARWGRSHVIPRVLDAGRWKPVMNELVPISSEVVCSGDFVIPTGNGDPVPWILAQGADFAAVTNGPAPVRWKTKDTQGSVEMEKVHAVDTLGAGDFFHGAYSFARLFSLSHAGGWDPCSSLRFAAHIAALKCTHPGTREWLTTVSGVTPLNYLRTERQ